MKYVHMSCPSGNLSYLDPSYLRLFNPPRVSLSIHNTAKTSPRPGCPLSMSGEKVVGDGNFHGTSRSGSSGWTSFREDECGGQNLRAVGLTEVMGHKQQACLCLRHLVIKHHAWVSCRDNQPWEIMD